MTDTNQIGLSHVSANLSADSPAGRQRNRCLSRRVYFAYYTVYGGYVKRKKTVEIMLNRL